MRAKAIILLLKVCEFNSPCVCFFVFCPSVFCILIGYITGKMWVIVNMKLICYGVGQWLNKQRWTSLTRHVVQFLFLCVIF